MITKDRNIKELIAAIYNPRYINKNDFEQLKKSIDTFGTVEPAVINMNKHRLNTIIGGHQRLRAAQELGYKVFPCVELDLNEKQERELNIRLNKNTGQFDFDKLANEFDMGDLQDWGFDESEFLGIEEEETKEDSENIYTNKVESPHYVITGKDPEYSEMFDMDKTKELIKQIESSKISKEEKQFLIATAYRHIEYNYSNIAEHYAHASKEVQELMENSALIILDFDDAIEKGYVKLTEELKQAFREDNAK